VPFWLLELVVMTDESMRAHRPARHDQCRPGTTASAPGLPGGGGYPVPGDYVAVVAIRSTCSMLARSSASLLGPPANHASRISPSSGVEVSRRLSANTLASFHFRAPSAV